MGSQRLPLRKQTTALTCVALAAIYLHDQETMNSRKFFAELKRRKVYSVAVTYGVVGWLLIQVVTQVFPPFEIPNWAQRLVILAILLGFPIALVLAWVYDFTRQGIKRTSELDAAKIDTVKRPAVSARPTSSERSIAVLPFSDLSPGKDHAYFSDGIAEEILSALAKTEGLRVAARRSSFWFKGKEAELGEIAQKLNVEHVLEGSVRRDGNRVRITAELIDVGDGFTVWSETFDREMQGIFAVQDEITRSIVEALKLRLDISAPPTSRSLDAYDVYLQGLFYSDKSTEEALQQSLEFFERALEKDPQLSRAWTGIAKAWLWLADAYLPPREAYAKVREAATNALKIDNDDAEAHVYLGEVKRILDWDMDGAAREFCRAVEIDPKSTPSNYFSAAFWAARGERDEALAYLQRTSKIDPASLWVNNSACELYRYFGLYDEAIAAGERALQLDPAFVYGEPLLAALYRETGRFDDAIRLYEKAENLSGRPAFGLAITYARMDRRDEAVRALNAATANRRYTPGDANAHVHVALGERDDAIRELERACDERSSSLHFVGIAPEFAPLRSDERFLSILSKIGLEPEKVFASTAQHVRDGVAVPGKPAASSTAD
jgi:adenylate cyclase